VDVLGVAPYFGSYDPTTDTSLDALVAKTQSSIDDDKRQVAEHKAIAEKFGVALVTYEAGPGMVGNGAASDLAIAVNRDVRMRELYLRYANMLRSAGVALHMHFTSVGRPSRFGSWGLLEATDQNRRSAPKHLGLADFMDATATCRAPSAEPEGCPDHKCSHSGLCLLPWVPKNNDHGLCGCYFGTHGASGSGRPLPQLL
jgi:hypothetical protein